MNGIIIIAAGMVGVVVGFMLRQKRLHLLKHGKKASAVIFKNNYEASRDGGGTYYPVVRFLTDKQEWITQELDIGFVPPRKEGEKVQVLYDPENPTDVVVNSKVQLVIIPSVFIGLGIVAIVIGLLQALQIFR